jgi:glycogen debranching enzyme
MAMTRTFWLAMILFPLGAETAVFPPEPVAPAVASPSADPTLLKISRQTDPARPFSVVGPRGALLGEQDGGFEAWVFPWKIFHNMRISARMQDYPVPMDVNSHAAEIEVRPNETTIVYSHANFTIRQIMMAPKNGPAEEGVLVLYQIEAIRPITLTFSFDPVMQLMWPAPSDDHPSPEWVPQDNGSGFYILHLNFPDHAAGLALLGAEPGILPPYQEKAAPWPLQFVLHFDPARDQDKVFPLLVYLAETQQAASKAALADSLAAIGTSVPATVAQNLDYYRKLLRSGPRLETPDAGLNAAFTWAIVAIDQLRVKTTPGLREQALTAGFVGSDDTTRPGFGWFFGRDALWSLYAVNSYGGFATTREELDFLAGHQRNDGKIMHEWSQTADLVDWAALPYQWASADATPLFLMAANDYLSVSGDTAFIEHLWPSLERAWRSETADDSARGIDNNLEGSGWVESWVPKMPYQEIYLAVLDEQASTALAHLARAAQHEDVATEAEARARRIAPLIEQEYYLPALRNYAFSYNPDGSTDDTATIFPAVAWWDGTFSLEHCDSMFERWASSEFSTDWGTRILSDRTSFYDPIAYHQGSVWPLFTGWVSVAEYRTGHPLSGYSHLMQNAGLSWAQDLGDVTELLSGAFFQMLGRSTAHQLWSSAMVISPILRGLFGLEWDAVSQRLTVTPQLPAEWDGARLLNVPFGSGHVDLTLERKGTELLIRCTGGPAGLHLASRAAGSRVVGNTLMIPLPAIEVGSQQSLPNFGATVRQMKVLDEQHTAHSLKVTLAAPGGAVETMDVRKNAACAGIQTAGAVLDMHGTAMGTLQIQFPPSDGPGDGYVERDVTLTCD